MSSHDDQIEKKNLISNLEKHLPAQLQPELPPAKDEIQDDYEYSRATYRNLVDKSNEAIGSMLELAMQSEHPRAFEVLSNMLKNTSDMTDKLLELQKKRKELEQKKDSPAGEQPKTNNNTAIFIGSTTDLQKHLLDKLTQKNVTDSVSHS
jgi:hypothetical protein